MYVHVCMYDVCMYACMYVCTGLIAHKWGLFLSTYAHSPGHIGGNVMCLGPIDGVGG